MLGTIKATMRPIRFLHALALPARRALGKLGSDLKNARLRRRLSTTLVAERAFLNRKTLRKIEMGNAGVSMGAYASVLFVLGMTDRLADGLRNSGALVADARVRAPHILSLKFPKGIPEGFVERLAAEQVYVAPRLGRIRISPHVYNDEADVDHFIEVFRKLAGCGL